MTALFRITEIEGDGGKIVIDGVDISTVGLSLLRLSLSIIPQDPVMFSNTVRYNLDPFGERSEYEIWEGERLMLEFVFVHKVIIQLYCFLSLHSIEKGQARRGHCCFTGRFGRAGG